MAAIGPERVLSVRHWNETVFSFATTRNPSLRFENGHFVMLGLLVDGKPLMRAYSIASANHEERLEFLSIKVNDGPLTSRLQHIKPGDEILVSHKPTGTLLLRDLRPGKRLYLLGSGTGLAPFLSLIKDPEIFERFEKVILVHGVRYRSELAYRDFIEWELTHHEYLGEQVRNQLVYFPTVTRERFRYQGRITSLIETGTLFKETNMPPLDPLTDRVMICGSPSMLTDLSALLDARGFQISSHVGEPGDYVIERSFVAR
ncbi:MAG: ferredoxin/flavodoxin---NADP+ reductase [Gammaproteobacteria bacterium]|nr:ferredoxin/flavodoxin---NADP+ reductase [Gammaproteobacteria bacterium]